MLNGSTSRRELLHSSILGQESQNWKKQISSYSIEDLESRSIERTEKNIINENIQRKTSIIKINEPQKEQISTPYSVRQIPPKLSPALSRRKLMNDQNSSSQHSIKGGSQMGSSQKIQNIIDIVQKSVHQSRIVKDFVHQMIDQAYVQKNEVQKLIQKYKNNQSSLKNNENLNNNGINKHLYPSSKFICSWDLFSIIINLISFWISLYLFSFKDDSFATILIVQVILFIFFILDAIVDSQRGLILQGEIITQKSVIINFYYKQQLAEDLVYGLFWTLVMCQINQHFIANEIITIILVLISVKKINKKYQQVVDSLYLKGALNNAIYDLFTLIVAIILFAHFMACIWHYIGLLTESQGSWLTFYGLENASTFRKYTSSFYWATTTMVTVGYGDITPKNPTEMYCAVLLMLCSSCMFGYLMNSVGIIVKNLNDNRVKYKRSLILINTYMGEKNVCPQLQSRITNYIKFQLESELDDNQEELNQLLSTLPHRLTDELKTAIQQKIIDKISFLRELFSQESVNKLAQYLETVQYTPGDYIYQKNNQEDHNLYMQLNQYYIRYYIENGQVDIVDERSGKSLASLQEGQCFGFYSFFTGYNTDFSIQAKKITQLYKIDRKTCLNIFKINAKDWEQFHQMKDQIIFNNDSNKLKLNQECVFCKKQHNISIKCLRKITYQPNLEVIYKRMYYKQEQQQREKFDRYGEKMNSLYLNQQIITNVQDFQIETLQSIPQDRIESDSKPKIELIQQIDSKNKFDNQNPQSLTYIKATHQKRNSIYLKAKRNSGELSPSVFSFNVKNNLFQQSISSYITLDIDRLRNYQHYLPHNNSQQSILSYNAKKLIEIPQLLLKNIIKYTFNFSAIQIIANYKSKLIQKRVIRPKSLFGKQSK